MTIIENNIDCESKKGADRAMQNQKIRESMPSIKHKFLVMSSQKGVGKTSVIVNLAMAISKRGLKVGLMDVNFHNPGIRRMLGLDLPVAWDPEKQFIPIAYSDNVNVASIASIMQKRDGSGVWQKPVKISDILSFVAGVNWGNLDFLFVDTPAGPGEKLLAVIQDIPEADIILVTAPGRISRDRAKEMIIFFEKERIPIFGWIENMRGFLCQHCSQRQELFSSGSGRRAIFLMDTPFLGRIPIDPHLPTCVEAGVPFVKKYPDSQAAEAYNLIAEKVIEQYQREALT